MRDPRFFHGVHQIDVLIDGHPGKTPTFYYDGSSMAAAFPARLKSLRRLMPDTEYVPARLAPGIGIVAVACLEYDRTDIGPYNELVVSVLLDDPRHRFNLPGRVLFRSPRTTRVDAYVMHMPVTTGPALTGGVELYGFPKFIADIQFDEAAGQRRCRVAEGSRLILTFTGDQPDESRSGQIDWFFHLWMDGQQQTAHFREHQLTVGTTYRPEAAQLELDRAHPIARELDRLLIRRQPLVYESCSHLEGILFGPERLTLPLIQRELHAAEAARRTPSDDRMSAT